MNRRDRDNKPRPDMIWSETFEMWVEPDTRSELEKAKDEICALQVDLKLEKELTRDLRGTMMKIAALEPGYLFQAPVLAKDRLEMAMPKPPGAPSDAPKVIWTGLVFHSGQSREGRVVRNPNGELVFEIDGGTDSMGAVRWSPAGSVFHEFLIEAGNRMAAVQPHDVKPQVKLEKIQYPDEKGGLTLAARSPAFAILASECVRLFKEDGGKNYVEWTMQSGDPEFGSFTVVIQRSAGKTPAQRATELSSELEAAKANMKAVEESLKHLGLEPWWDGRSISDGKRPWGQHVGMVLSSLKASAK